MKKIEMIIKDDTSERLDSYLSKKIKDISRSEIKKLIKNGEILVNDEIKKPKYTLKKSDNVIINIPIQKRNEVIPQNIKLDILYEDNDIAIINKPIGMVVHPAPGNFTDTLVNALLYNLNNLSDLGGEIRPGIVHRLDKDTSGLLVVAKNNYSHEILSNYFKNRDVKREYIALVKGVLKEEKGIIDKPIGRNPKNRKKMAVIETNSKNALTKYEVLQRFKKYTLIKASLETGRTHQIRVHFSHIKHPIVGDVKYSRKNEFNLNGQLLHSIRIGFVHPKTYEYMEFSTAIPDRFDKVIKKIK
ncbi:MAG: RluA family pseudouridine synthase [Tissierella sp.]|uniref:RluA family pseudouridine synthase n=1 Tax=Tissierella sp. TaxID=41274 RepID=UPI003F962A4B